MKKIGLYIKSSEKALKKADDFEKWLISNGISVVRRENHPPQTSPGQFSEQLSAPKAPPDLDCIFVLGGDGTLLSAVRWIGNQNIPLIGVKFGMVGFLAETTEDQLFIVAQRILNKQFTTETRMRLQVKLIRNGRQICCENILNDLVINKGAIARLADIQTSVNDKYLTTYRADGLIIATPTGSTAYSLAAGGPVLHPAVPGIIMTPICPFTLTNRPLIIPDSARISIRLEEKSSDMMLTFDGQAGLQINEQDNILVTKSPYPISLITYPGQSYFDVLKEKLRWSGGRV